jgi:uncharacterized membrane protein YtjA (UPF0391 family)
MLKWAIIFFVISIVAGFFGFTGVSRTTSGISKVLFFIFLIGLLIIVVFGLMLGKLVF